MSLTKGRALSGTSKQVVRRGVSNSSMRNGEEVVQMHRGRLKVIRKEFGKLFELEFVPLKGQSEQKELKTFAKHSDVKKPSRDAIKIFEGGVRAGTGKKFYGSVPTASDSHTIGGEFEIAPDGESLILK